MKFLITNEIINRKRIEDFPSEISINELGPYTIMVEQPFHSKETSSQSFFVDGYLRDFNGDKLNIEIQEKNAISAISGQWPLPSNFSGSFSATLINNESFEICICNDVIGLYPLYYLIQNQAVYVSNSIIWIGAISSCSLDEIGIYQRSTGPEYSNIGSRTILQDCKRLLPGEKLIMDPDGNIVLRQFDNTLYNNISDPILTKGMARDYWQTLQEEIDFCLGNSKSVNIALSGGIDSRIILGGIPEDKNVTCLTFGGEENYETKVASRLAGIKKAEFKNFSDLKLFFPHKNLLEKYSYQTEAAYLLSWLEILEHLEVKRREPLLIGDLTTAITGRAISKFSSKHYMQKFFVKHNILQKNYQFQDTNSFNIKDWKDSETQKFKIWYNEKSLSQFNFKISLAELRRGLESDLNEIFDRIDDHNLPYIELYDELFSWFTHSRIPVGKQVLFCNKDFDCYSPSMSTRIIRGSSNIHPNLRLSLRFVKALIRESKELNMLSRVPTSQAPFLPQYFPEFLKFPVWGLRYKIDQYLIKRMVDSKDIRKRYRLFKSMNWAMIYQNPEMETNLKSYYEVNHLGEGYFKNTYEKCLKRKEFNAWPFANTEIISGASLNLELNFIENLRET